MNQSTTKNWLQRIDANTQLVVELFGALDVETLNRKPSAEKWSIAQNLDHIITINRSYDPIIHSIRTGTLNLPFIARFPFLVRLIGKLILNSVDPTRRKKIKTIPMWEPSQSPLPADIISRFAAHQEQLKTTILSLEDLVHRNIVIHSPANRYIVYTLPIAIEIIVTHELRHIHQAQELLKD